MKPASRAGADAPRAVTETSSGRRVWASIAIATSPTSVAGRCGREMDDVGVTPGDHGGIAHADAAAGRRQREQMLREHHRVGVRDLRRIVRRRSRQDRGNPGRAQLRRRRGRRVPEPRLRRVRDQVLFLEVDDVLDPDAVGRAPHAEALGPDQRAEHARDPELARRAAQRRRDLGEPQVEPRADVAGDGVRDPERGDARCDELLGRDAREVRRRVGANLGDPDRHARDHHEDDDRGDERSWEAAEAGHSSLRITAARERPSHGQESRRFSTASAGLSGRSAPRRRSRSRPRCARSALRGNRRRCRPSTRRAAPGSHRRRG